MRTFIEIIAVLALLFVLYYFFSPARSGVISGNMYAMLCGFVNFYAYRASGGVILFDTGMNPGVAKKSLAKAGINPDEVTHIFLTHTDYDHAGGLAAFKNAEIFITGEEEQMINGQTARRGLVHNGRVGKYTTLENGKKISAGGAEIECFLTPGHTPGSASYLVDNCFYISGDLLRVARGSNRVTPFMRLMNKDHALDIKSVAEAKPAIKNAEYLLTAHTGWRKVSELSFI